MPRSLTSHDLDYITGRFWIQHDRLEEEVLTALTPHTADCSSNAVSLNQTKIAERFNHNMMDRRGEERRGETESLTAPNTTGRRRLHLRDQEDQDQFAWSAIAKQRVQTHRQ